MGCAEINPDCEKRFNDLTKMIKEAGKTNCLEITVLKTEFEEVKKQMEAIKESFDDKLEDNHKEWMEVSKRSAEADDRMAERIDKIYNLLIGKSQEPKEPGWLPLVNKYSKFIKGTVIFICTTFLVIVGFTFFLIASHPEIIKLFGK